MVGILHVKHKLSDILLCSCSVHVFFPIWERARDVFMCVFNSRFMRVSSAFKAQEIPSYWNIPRFEHQNAGSAG